MEVEREESIVLEGGGVSGGSCRVNIRGKPFGFGEEEDDIPLMGGSLEAFISKGNAGKVLFPI